MAEDFRGTAASDPARVFADGEALARDGRLSDAEAIFRGLLRAYPDHPAVMNSLALVAKARGDAAQAERLLRAAAAAAPHEPAYRNNLGNVLRTASKLPEAEACLRQALALKPDYAEAHYNLAIVLEETGRTAEALAAHQTAVAHRPQYAPALTRTGALLTRRGEQDEALRVLDAASAAAPDFFDAHYYRGIVLAALERYDEALEALRRAAGLKPDRFEAALAIANTLRDAGRLEEALAAFQLLVERNPSRVETHTEIARIAHVLGKDEARLSSFDYARRLTGDNPDLLLTEALYRSRLDQDAEAEDLLRRARTLAPQRADIARQLGNILAKRKHFEEAAPFFQAAIAAEPTNVFHRHQFAFALLSAGEPAEARRVLEEARALAPDDQLTLSALSLALRALGDERYRKIFDPTVFVRSYDVRPPEGIGAADFNRILADELDRFHSSKIEPIEQTLRGGTQTMGSLFTRRSALVQQLRRSIDEAVADYIRAVPANGAFAMPGADRFTYSGSWSCRLHSAGYHTNHVHPMGRISSAYYVRLPEAIADEEARQGWITFGESNLGLGETDAPERFVRPEVGQLVLFPSFYWHGTTPFTSEKDRLTVAFDVVPA